MSGDTKKPYPRSVQQQLDKAIEIERQLATPPTPEPQDPPVDPAPAPAPPVEPSEPTPAPPVEAPKPEPWEQRYRSLQGQFNTMVPQLQQEVRTLTVKLQEALQDMAALKAKPVEPPAPKVTDKDVEVFGSDLVDMSRRVAQEAAAAAIAQQQSHYEPLINTLKQQIASLESQLGSVNESVSQSATDRYYATLVQYVPDWEAVNADTRFLAWLAEQDPMYGEPRQAALDRAYGALDASRTAAVFKAFKATLPAAPKPAPRNELTAHVSPTRAPAQPQQDAPQGRSFTGSEIQTFYENKRRNRYDPETARTLENEINDAIANGRVTP